MMTFLVGYSPHKDDLCALDLACQLARSDRGSVHAVSVVLVASHSLLVSSSVRCDVSRSGERPAAQRISSLYALPIPLNVFGSVRALFKVRFWR